MGVEYKLAQAVEYFHTVDPLVITDNMLLGFNVAWTLLAAL